MAILFQKEVPEKGSYDIVVAGGGVAGAAAALAGARAGKSVLLLEKSTMLGGLATLGLINYFVPMCNGRGVQIIKGMAEEFLRLSIKNGYDTLPEEWRNGEPAEPTNVRYVTKYSATIFALELLNLLHNEGVDVLFDTVVAEPVMDGALCKGVICENKSGLEYYAAKMLVDTTGDADLLYRAGVPTVQGRNFHTYVAHGANLQSCKQVVDTENIAKLYVSYAGGH
ncbi:MAG: FAD-dependent oxidoreductase, partial [Clostridia bacterium]|nr:FAD-dependent oxidoreductase [Clostridia bacterium]